MYFLGKKPPHDWPSIGTIQFNQMSLRYVEAEQPVLKDISCLIRAKEKVPFFKVAKCKNQVKLF